MIDLDKDIELYKSKVAFYKSQNTRGEYDVTVRELKYIVEILETLRSERTQGDAISREALRKTICDMNFDFGNYYDHTDEIIDRVCEKIDNVPPVPERDYSQGWHDAITKALNEAYTITTEDGSFKVVQTETLEGLGMSMPDKKGECCGSCYLCDVADCGVKL